MKTSFVCYTVVQENVRSVLLILVVQSSNTNKIFMMLFLILCLCIVGLISAQYQVPEAVTETYRLKGFSVAIPDENGNKNFAFHGKVNGGDADTLSNDIVGPTFGVRTLTQQSSRVKVGGGTRFWTSVEYSNGNKKQGSPKKDDQVFTVKQLVHKPTGNEQYPVSNNAISNPARPTTSVLIDTRVPGVITEISCAPTVTVMKNGIKTCKGELIFNEIFNGVLSKYWTIENRFAEKPDYEFVIYTDRPEGIYLTNKSLVIQPELGEKLFGPNFVEEALDLQICTGVIGTSDCYNKPDAGFILPPVLSAKMTTKKKFSFKYGRIEVRAKLPKGDWIYPILTLNSENEEYGPGYESGQIRIAFTPGNDAFNRNLYGGLVLGDSPAARSNKMKSIESQRGWSSEYHRFGVIWREDQITLTVNDKVYGTIFPPAGGFSSLGSRLNAPHASRWKTGSILAPFDKEMYISVGVGVGGFNFEDRKDGTKPWKNGERLSLKKFHAAQAKWSSTWNEESKLSVEYIKVWAL